MAIRKYKPTTPGRRGSSVADFVEVTRDTPEKSLVRPLSKKGGRNNSGRITTRHQGGGQHGVGGEVGGWAGRRVGRRVGGRGTLANLLAPHGVIEAFLGQ